MIFGSDGRWQYGSEPVADSAFSSDQRNEAQHILAKIKNDGKNVNAQVLMRLAQLSHDLWGQQLFQLLTTLVYRRVARPSETHRAIAEFWAT